MNNKRIALYLPSLGGGGAERVMLNLVKAFSMYSYTTDLVLCKAKGPYLSQVPKNVRIVDLNKHRVIACILALRRYLQLERPTVLLSALDHANVAAIWAQRLSGVPTRIAVSVHSMVSRPYRKSLSFRVRVLMPQLMRTFYPWADKIIAVSHGVAQDLAQLTGIPLSCIQVVHNPIIMTEVLQLAKEPVEHQWFLPGQPPVILAVGRLTTVKDYPTLIRAFALVRKQCRAHLVILGEGEQRKELEKLIREMHIDRDVDLVGFKQNPYSYTARASVFVLSSTEEGFGNVLVEALAVGTPVVSTDCPSGPREILDGGKYGALVPVADPDKMASAILEAIKSQDRSPDVKKRAMDFDINTISKRYIEVLDV